ncbi:MAG: winged helix-turn-helix domain-containing protein [Rhizomicrobium sp.]|jgi:DNA-binding winged helix-turn-helix (wHTH) protein
MSPRAASEHPFLLGDWSVDPARGVIVARDGGAEIRLEPRNMDLLLLFAGEPGKVLSKDRIVASVWGGRAIGDDTLAGAVSRLRAALGNSRAYIETVPKRGYRLLIAPDEDAASESSRVSGEQSQAATLVARGFAELKSPLSSGLDQARIYFEGAIRADPKHAPAHAGLAEAMLRQHLLGKGDAGQLLAAAKSSAQAAIALDERLAHAWATFGFATLLSQHDFAAADAVFLKAIALDARAGLAHRYRGFALTAVGRFVDAEREMRKAVEIEPYSLSARADLTQCLTMARRFRPAIAETKRTLDLAPKTSEAWAAKGWAHHFLGEDREARDAFFESLRAWGASAATLEGLRDAHRNDGIAGFSAAAADLFESQQMVFSPRLTDIAILRATAGDADAAFAILEKAVARDDCYLLWLPHMPHLDRLHNDPRFAALLERIRVVR